MQTLEGRVHSSDAREMLCFYRHYNSNYEQTLRTARKDEITSRDEDPSSLDER